MNLKRRPERKDLNKVSNDTRELIDNGVTEKVYKNLRKANLRI